MLAQIRPDNLEIWIPNYTTNEGLWRQNKPGIWTSLEQEKPWNWVDNTPEGPSKHHQIGFLPHPTGEKKTRQAKKQICFCKFLSSCHRVMPSIIVSITKCLIVYWFSARLYIWYVTGARSRGYSITAVQFQLFCNFITYRAKLLNADWFRQRAFFLNFPSMEGKITRP